MADTNPIISDSQAYIKNLILQLQSEMDIQYNSQLTPKSKGILYRLKRSLARENITLKNLVCNIFGFQKGKFKLQQFHLLIHQYDSHLILKDIDQLFDSLDESKNQIIFLQAIQKALQSISEQDDPSTALNKKSKIVMTNEMEKKKMDAIIEFKDTLLRSEDYLEVICLFSTEKNGFLTRDNMSELLNNFEYKDQSKKRAILQYVFGDKNKVQIKNLLQKLGLEAAGTRIHVQESPMKEKKAIREEDKSEFIKEQQKSRIRQPGIKINDKIFEQKMRQSMRQSYNQQSIHYGLQNIPSSLQPYFNYGSELEEPFASYASQYLNKKFIFVDESNPTYSRARNWVHLAEINPHYQLFEVAKSIIKRDKTRKGLGAMLQPKDIIQGSIGDCYFLSAIAAIVQDYPQLVYRLFVLQKNPSHMFGVKLFVDGVWTTIPLDACFPVNNFGGFCGAQPHHNEVWVMLLEKAWAKIYKSYDNIIAGYNHQGLVAISGAPTVQVSSKKEGFLKNIIAEFGKGAIITCATSKQVIQLTDKQQQNLGVFAGHAYTLLKVFENLPYKNTKVTLLKIRNPWGRKGWKGDWSFNSQTWTRELKQRVGYEMDPQDGSFFVSLSDFIIYFDYINISKVHLAYRNSHAIIKSSRFEFTETRFKIKDGGDYFFTLYQENGRKFKNMGTVYQKSKCWLFLAKINNKTASYQIQKLTAIACISSLHQNPTIQTTLQPGQYVLISKVSWRYWNQHTYAITSYGPSKVLFGQSTVASPEIINKFIQSRADEISKHGGGSTHIYENKNISRRVDFNLEDGIGFLTVTNFDNCMLQDTVYFESCKGIQVVPPFSLPIKLFVMPYQIVTVGFIVDPEGYSYGMKQKYYFRPAH